MIKALFRKQFAEIVAQFSGRGGAKANASPKKRIVLFLVIFGVLYLSLLYPLFLFSKELINGLSESTFPLFYMVIGLIATALGLLGSVFNAYSTIFEAKDNEMLLSLPIQPHRIVFVRVVTLSAMTLFYAGAVLLPAAIAFLFYAKTSFLGKFNALLLFVPLTLLVEAVTLGIAFVVALIARRVKNKKAVVMVFSLLLTLGFYFLYFRAQNFVTKLLALGRIPALARYGLFFYYALGRASQGSPLNMLLALAVAGAAFALAYLLLSRNFVKFTTTKKGSKEKVKKGVVKSTKRSRTLFKREWKVFSSSPAYVMNSAFGVLFLIAIPIAAIIKADFVHSVAKSLAEAIPHADGSGIAAMVILFTEGMCCVTAPSVSIEGRRLYLLRVLPIDAREVFRAKVLLQLVVALPGTLFASVVLAAVLRLGALGWIFLILLPAVHVLFTGLIGLCLNIDFPVLDWKDEMTAIKSGAGVLITVFGTMFSTLAVGGLYFLFAFFLPDWVYLLIATLLYLGADLIMMRWLVTRGKDKFEKLG